MLINQERLSATGKWAVLLSILFVFSINATYRLHFGGFLIHPYLLVLPFAIFFTGARIFSVSRSVLVPLLLFFLIFSIASLQNSNPLEEIIKVGASVLTFLFFASAVQSEKDFRAICLGFILCAVVIGYLGFGKSETATHRLGGINALEGIGNKNAQSLFTLPGVFVAILMVLEHMKRRNLILIVLLGIALFFIIVSVFLSANRSGWVGIILVAFCYLVYLRLQARTLLIFSALFIFSYIAITVYASDIVEHKVNKTLEGYISDGGRIILIKESLLVGFENPVLGVGDDELHKRMNRAVRVSSLEIGMTDTHFLVGYIFGATGVITLFFFLLFLKRTTDKLPGSKDRIRLLMIGFVLLFLVRSAFSREILYSPTFIGGMGLVYSYYVMRHKVAESYKRLQFQLTKIRGVNGTD